MLGRKLRGNEQNFHITKETYESLRALAEEIWPEEKPDPLAPITTMLKTYSWFRSAEIVDGYVDVRFYGGIAGGECPAVHKFITEAGYIPRWCGLSGDEELAWRSRVTQERSNRVEVG